MPPAVDASVARLLSQLQHQTADYLKCLITAIAASGVSAEVVAAVSRNLRAPILPAAEAREWAACAALFDDVSRFRERAEAVRVDKACKVKIP